MIIKSYSKINKDEYKKILALSNECENFDNIAPVMFLEDDLNYDSSFECYYEALEDGDMVGFVSVFVPGDGTAEIYGMIKPSFRRKGLFNELVNTALTKVKERGIGEIYYVCTPACPDAKKTIYSKKLNIDHSEYLLRLSKDFNEKPDSDLKLEVRKEGNSAYYFETKMADDHVGECMLEFEEDMASIYDFNVEGKFRGKGYGSKSLVLILNYIIDNLTDNVVLQLHGDNKAASNMYFHHGFEIISQIDFIKLV